MNAPQENKLSMYLTVIRVCKAAADQWSGLAAFAANFAAFEGMANTISSLETAQATTKDGVTLQKETITTGLLDETMRVAGAVAAFAAVTGDETLEAKVGFTRTELAQLRDAQIDDRAQAVLDLAQANLAALAAYGVVPATLEGLAAKIEAYTAVVEAPRAATVKVKTITEAIAATFDRADRVLERVLDRLALQFAVTAPTLAGEYKNARIIVDRPGGRAKAEPAAPGAG